MTNSKLQSPIRTSFRSKLFLALLAAFSLAATNLWARLPHPIQASGVVLVSDQDTKCLVFKAARVKKPVVLDWNKDTEFVRNGQLAAPKALPNNTRVTIYYRDVSFRNPLLKKVIWDDPPGAE